MRIRNFFKKNKVIIKNFSFLSILQLVQLLSVFLTYPYLIKTLGQSNYGVIAYSQAIINYFVIIVNYGFNATATKQIASSQEDIKTTNRIISSVFFCKLILGMFSLLMLLAIILLIPFLNKYWYIYVSSSLSILGWVLFPEWYFQGIEKMENITYIMVFVKVTSAICIFFFIKEPGDFYIVPIINSGLLIIGGIMGVILLLKSKESIKINLPKIKSIIEQYKIGISYFLSNVIANTKDYLNTILIGVFLNYESVALYDLVNKIIRIAALPCSILARAIFPRIAKIKSFNYNKKVERIMIVISTSIALTLFLTPNFIWQYFVKQNLSDFIKLLNVMLLSIPLLALASSRGFLILIAFNKDRYFTKGILISFILYFLCALFLIVFGVYSLYTAALIIIFSLLLEITSHLYHTKKSQFKTNLKY